MEATGGRLPMTVVDLFSGAGGMSAGFHTHPDLFRIVGAADIEVGKPGLGRIPERSPTAIGLTPRTSA